jgi:hypothetical protein
MQVTSIVATGLAAIAVAVAFSAAQAAPAVGELAVLRADASQSVPVEKATYGYGWHHRYAWKRYYGWHHHSYKHHYGWTRHYGWTPYYGKYNHRYGDYGWR